MDLLTEYAHQIDRGVRPMAFVGIVRTDRESMVSADAVLREVDLCYGATHSIDSMPFVMNP